MSGRGKIDAYLDCNSPYSLYAATWLKRNKELLAQHDVDVELHPIFLGGINVGSGNKPPWTLEAKAKYSKFDGPRVARYFDLEPITTPSFFPIMTLLPLRCMLYIKDHFPMSRYEDQFLQLWQSYLYDHEDISKPDLMRKCLSHHFDAEEVERIIEGGTSPKYKKLLTEETAGLVSRGAFGAPWFEVTAKDGRVEPFFGSDRFHVMLSYLEVPYQDIAIIPKDRPRL